MSQLRTPVFVTGIPRSGTSLTAGLLDIHGFFGGKTIGANKDNKKGFFENQFIREKVIKPRLSAAGIDVLAQEIFLLPTEVARPKLIELNKKSPVGFRSAICSAIQDQGYESGPWYYKCAKLPLFAELAARAFPEATLVVVRREKEGHISSLQRTGFMKCCKNDECWSQWIDSYWSYTEHLTTLFSDVHEILFDELLQSNFDQIAGVVESRGLSFSRERAAEFLCR